MSGEHDASEGGRRQTVSEDSVHSRGEGSACCSLVGEVGVGGGDGPKSSSFMQHQARSARMIRWSKTWERQNPTNGG